jgi:hypothetical protein
MLMKKTILLFAALVMIVISGSSASYASGPAALKHSPPKMPENNVYTDPFSYCNCAGTIDAPDKRYQGEKVPDSIVPSMRKVMKLGNDTPADYIKQTTFWRCMDRKVFVCIVGANLPCMEKADLRKTPDAAMMDYCENNPDTDFIPAYVTGRTTVYEWRCSGKAPAISKQLFKPDARGFISDIWFELPAQ